MATSYFGQFLEMYADSKDDNPAAAAPGEGELRAASGQLECVVPRVTTVAKLSDSQVATSHLGQLLEMYDDSKDGRAAAAPPGERELRAGENGSAEDGNEPPSVEHIGGALKRWEVCNLLHHGRNFFRCRLCFNVMVQKLPKIDGIPTRRFTHRDLPSTDPRSERFR